MTVDTQRLAQAWIAHWREHAATGGFPDTTGSWDVDRLAREEPEVAWTVILEILSDIKVDPSESLFQVLAAGPMEDLLVEHGYSFISRVEQQSKIDPSFRLLLGGVWPNSMSQEVWERVLRCRGEAW